MSYLSYFECETCSSGWSGDPTSPRLLDKIDQHERDHEGHRVREAPEE
jgi:hypothetical protein